MKEYFEKIIAAKEARAKELRELIQKSESVNEVRSLGDEMVEALAIHDRALTNSTTQKSNLKNLTMATPTQTTQQQEAQSLLVQHSIPLQLTVKRAQPQQEQTLTHFQQWNTEPHSRTMFKTVFVQTS